MILGQESATKGGGGVTSHWSFVYPVGLIHNQSGGRQAKKWTGDNWATRMFTIRK